MKLLTTANTKTLKSNGLGYMTAVLHLSPAATSGFQVCPKATQGCKMSCLAFAGRGVFSTVQKARIEKTKYFFQNREAFMVQLVKEIESFVKKAVKNDAIPAIRLNTLSDLPFYKFRVVRNGIEYRNLMVAFPTVQFYDYTAVFSPAAQNISNYHLTFSRKESNEGDVAKAVAAGMNVTVAFDIAKTAPLPVSYMGLPVISGDNDDARFLDPKGVIVGLYIKGTNKAKQAARDSGFAVRV
jgi:hypothetical protein